MSADNHRVFSKLQWYEQLPSLISPGLGRLCLVSLSLDAIVPICELPVKGFLLAAHSCGICCTDRDWVKEPDGCKLAQE